ncbi:MAG: hypothetical protein IJ763_08650 [Lachnospiraceae bacterium]|nr:hypothetical protein [Lachnospiraceae bacterium]
MNHISASYLSFILALLGVIVGISIVSLIDQLISLLVRVCFGNRILSVKYLWFDMTETAGDKRWKIGKFSPVCQTMTIPKELGSYDEKKDIKISIIDLLLRLSVAAIIIIIIGACFDWGHSDSKAFMFWCGFGMWYIISEIFTISITIYLIANRKNRLSTYTRHIGEEFSLGVPLDKLYLPRYEELGLKATDYERIVYESFRFMQKVWLGDFSALPEIINNFDRILIVKDDISGERVNYIKVYTNAIYNEIFYYSYISFNPQRAKLFYDIINIDLNNDMDTNGRRVLAYYHYFVLNDIDMTIKFINEAYNVLDKFSIAQGERDYEKMLLENISNIIRVNTGGHI